MQGSSIVYVRTRRRTQEIASLLKANKISADYYHAGLAGEERSSKQQSWISGNTRVIVSTNAFGMGIDKPDVRTVVHLDIPDSLEAYYQEAGRAGRDGNRAFAVLLYDNSDLTDLMERAESREVSKDYIQQVYQSLSNHFQIAVGSHSMETLHFDLSGFCHSFDLNPVEAMKGLKSLEENAVIMLSDGAYQLSKLNFKVDKEALYKYQVANVKFEPILKALLRLYGGDLFTDYRTIKEFDLARLLKITKKEVIGQLNYLGEHDLLDYQSSTGNQTITFMTPRMVANDLPIDTDLIAFRAKTAIEKAKAMSDYADTTIKCRTRVFQNYFDEESLDNCGICDFCLNKKKDAPGIPTEEVLKELSEGASTVAELYDRVTTHTHEKILAAVRLLIDDGKIKKEGDKLTQA